MRVACATLSVFLVAGCGVTTSTPETSAPLPPPIVVTDPAPAPQLLAPPLPASPSTNALDRLRVAPESDGAGYERDLFGDGWASTGDTCDTRDAILERDATWTERDPAHPCDVVEAVVSDPYTGQATRVVDIDHLVALSEAWQSGAAEWSDDTRQAFADDGRNLLAVDASQNRSKGDQDVAEWLPENPGGRCFLAHQVVQVKLAYDLSVDEAERDALRRVLTVDCVVASLTTPPRSPQ